MSPCRRSVNLACQAQRELAELGQETGKFVDVLGPIDVRRGFGRGRCGFWGSMRLNGDRLFCGLSDAVNIEKRTQNVNNAMVTFVNRANLGEEVRIESIC